MFLTITSVKLLVLTFDLSKWVKDKWIIWLVILWLTSRASHKDTQDDWSSPITYFQVAVSYNLGKSNVPSSDTITKIWQPLIWSRAFFGGKTMEYILVPPNLNQYGRVNSYLFCQKNALSEEIRLARCFLRILLSKTSFRGNSCCNVVLFLPCWSSSWTSIHAHRNFIIFIVGRSQQYKSIKIRRCLGVEKAIWMVYLAL